MARPKAPERREPKTMPNFENSVKSPGGKERPEMKRDMVKPIPPSMLAPMMWDQDTPEGRGALNPLGLYSPPLAA